jgi:hypothetical protein
VADNQQALRAMTWQLHTYGADEVRRPEVPGWLTGPHRFAADPQGRLRPERAYLIRPDHFVAASIALRGNDIDATQLEAAMAAHRLVR